MLFDQGLFEEFLGDQYVPRKTNRPCSAEELSREIQNRLSRIEGQVRGLARMVESQCSPVKVLQQLASVRAALRGVTKVLVRYHLEERADEVSRSGDPRAYDELMDALYNFMK